MNHGIWNSATTKRVALGLVLFLLVVIGLSLRHRRTASASSGPTAMNGVAASLPAQTASPADAAAKPWGLDDLGAPDDPLPPALPLPAVAGPIQSAHAADALARRVLAGGPESLPALITALQASGIAIVGSGDSVVARPAEPWQGMTMKPWEVRAAAAMVLPQRTVTFTLTDLGPVLVAAVPELKDAPVEQLLLNDVRSMSDSQQPTRRFFARFLVALGQNATSHAPYDMLVVTDPQTIRVDGLQSSLLFRRLATDILMLTASKQQNSAAFFEGLRKMTNRATDWLDPTVYAQSTLPCTLDDRSRTIMDVVALGSQLAFGGMQVGDMGMKGIIDYLESHGFGKNLGTISAIASTLLAYAQFIATYAALEVDVTMEGAPLVRTRKRAPQSGERKELTALVKMNIGNAQMVNCFRIMLNAIGLDFSLPNNGPVKGAHVLWYGAEGFDQAAAVLHGGGEAIVQFAASQGSSIQAGGDASSGANDVTNAVTGEDGKVKISVEGIGQRQDILNDATQVNKSAKVRLDVALKGSDLFGDLQEATGTAAGGLPGLATVPLSILYRTKWASAGRYSFPVRDWRNGPARWTGGVNYSKVTEWNESQSHNAVHMEQEYSEELSLNVTVEETLEGADIFGSSGAAMRGTAQARHNERRLRSGGHLEQCGRVPVTDMKSLTVDTGECSGSGTARVSVGISADGQYSITVYPDVPSGTCRNNSTAQGMGWGKMCHIEDGSHSSSSGGTGPIEIDVIQGDGKIDPKTPDHLSGRTEEKDGKTTRTLTWDLQRQ